jgi:uncharacterized metal-binding protein
MLRVCTKTASTDHDQLRLIYLKRLFCDPAVRDRMILKKVAKDLVVVAVELKVGKDQVFLAMPNELQELAINYREVLFLTGGRIEEDYGGNHLL